MVAAICVAGLIFVPAATVAAIAGASVPAAEATGAVAVTTAAGTAVTISTTAVVVSAVTVVGASVHEIEDGDGYDWNCFSKISHSNYSEVKKGRLIEDVLKDQSVKSFKYNMINV